MAERGGLTHRFFRETKGVKVSDGQFVKEGTTLTRQADKWKRGINVGGKGTLYAMCSGNIYFTRKKGRYHTKKTCTFINVKEVKEKVKSKISS
jgi:ribosomal protein L27